MSQAVTPHRRSRPPATARLLLATVGSVGIAAGAPGCRSTAPLPTTAVIRAEGKDPFAYRAHVAGTAYVYDVTTGRQLWSGRVARGSEVRVDPAADGITVDGNKVYDRRLTAGDRYRIFFDDRPPPPEVAPRDDRGPEHRT